MLEQKITQENWFPRSEENGIVYEMEYIENKIGRYPATEGLLTLLAVLFSSGIAPSNLGLGSRTVPGCSPYIEYVVNFVLPRAMGTKRTGGIYFFKPSDRSRLLAKALKVVNAVLIRYSFLTSKENKSSQASVPNLISEGIPQDMLLSKQKINHKVDDIKEMSKPQSLSLVHEDIFVDDGDSNSNYADFVPVKATKDRAAGQQRSIPSRSKSPGFFILSDILSTDGLLLGILLDILKLCHSIESVDDLARQKQCMTIKSLSLFGEIQPLHTTAKAGRDYILNQQKSGLASVAMPSIPAQFIENFLAPLFEDYTENVPSSQQRNTAYSEDGIMWEEHCILLVLRILCASAGRNNDFKTLIDSSQYASCIVPVLDFRHKKYGSAIPLEVRNIQIDSIAKLITRDQSFLSLLAFYVGYTPSAVSNECSIAAAALSIINFVEEGVLPVDYERYMNGICRKDKVKIASSFAIRLSFCRNAIENDDQMKIGQSILNHLASYFSKNLSSEHNLYHVMMGLSLKSVHEKRDFLWQSSQGTNVTLCECNNVLDTMIGLLSDVNFILDPETSYTASKCFEIIYRLCSNEDGFFQVTKMCIMAKLRRISFWQSQMLRFLGRESSEYDSILKTMLARSPIQTVFHKNKKSLISRDSNLIHSTSWILKGVAQEFHCLMGHGVHPDVISSDDPSILSAISPQPRKCRELMKLLFSEPNAVIKNTLLSLPLEKPLLARQLTGDVPYQNVINLSTYVMQGPVEICRDYNMINVDKIKIFFETQENSDRVSNHGDLTLQWAEKWNSYMEYSCASSHLCHSWYIIAQTAFIFCQGSNEIDVDLALGTVQLVLHKLNTNKASRSDPNSLSIVEYETNRQLESSNTYHLSALCPFLTQQIVSTDDLISEGICQQLFLQILSAISSCNNGTDVEESHCYHQAAELCSALVSLLESESFKSFNLMANPSSHQFYTEAKNAFLCIGKLSLLTNQKYISYMARSAISSVLRWFDSVENSTETADRGRFLLDVFSSSNDFIPHYISLLRAFDYDVIDLLEQIACFSGGTELLVNNGLSNVLVSISKKFVHDAKMNNIATHTYGSVGVEVPKFLSSHLSFFNAMLSTDCPQSTRSLLISDVMTFLQIHSSNLEHLLLGYPKNNGLVLDIASCLCSLVSLDDTQTGFGLHYRSQAWYIQLERNVDNLAIHLANYPLPPKYLRKLPNCLRAFKASGSHNDRCWWDAIDPNVENDIIVPAPISIGLETQSATWSVAKYEAGIAASCFVDKWLTYTTNSSMQNEGTPFRSIASSLCQYTHLSEALRDRLSKLKSDGENYLSRAFSNMMEGGNNFDRLKYFNDIELQVLEKYYAVVQTCITKLLCLFRESFQSDNNKLDTENALLMIEVMHYTGLSTVSNNVHFSANF